MLVVMFLGFDELRQISKWLSSFQRGLQDNQLPMPVLRSYVPQLDDPPFFNTVSAIVKAKINTAIYEQ